MDELEEETVSAGEYAFFSKSSNVSKSPIEILSENDVIDRLFVLRWMKLGIVTPSLEPLVPLEKECKPL